MFNLPSSVASVTVSPMTELDAVNIMLASAGNTPLSTLENTLNADAVQARHTLFWSSRDVQLEGWHFNTEHNVTLLPIPPTPGIIRAPNNAIRVDIDINQVGAYSSTDVILRKGNVYDMKNHTFLFNEGITTTITYLLPFEELPDAARAYIATKAARRFRMHVTGGEDGAYSISKEDEARARASLVREDLLGQDLNFISPNRNSYIGHTSIGRVLRRRL